MADEWLPKSLQQVGEDNAEVVFAPPLFFLAPTLLGRGLESLAPTRLVEGPARWAVGGALVALWIALQGSAALVMHRAGTTPLPARPTTAIVARGPYGFTRNPMYVGFACAQAGIAFLAGSIWVLALTPVSIALVTWGAIKREENYLGRKFGAAYEDYQRRVRRWI